MTSCPLWRCERQAELLSRFYRSLAGALIAGLGFIHSFIQSFGRQLVCPTFALITPSFPQYFKNTTSVTMKFTIAVTLFALVTSATPLPHRQPQGSSNVTSTASGPPATGASNTTSSTSTSVNPDLVPQFGVTAGQDKSKSGTCLGINNVRIPCTCPPDRDQFISKLSQFVAAGNAFGTKTPFPEDDSKKSQITRIQTSIVALQNFDGQPGKGCPAASTTFLAQKSALAG